MTHNTATGNLFGFFFRDSEHGLFAHNFAKGNCVGIMTLDTGSPGAEGFVEIRQNRIFHNQKACPAGEGPPLSGIGIMLFGTTHANVWGNRVTKNLPSGPSFVTGGIVVHSAGIVGGADPTDERRDAQLRPRQPDQGPEVRRHRVGEHLLRQRLRNVAPRRALLAS